MLTESLLRDIFYFLHVATVVGFLGRSFVVVNVAAVVTTAVAVTLWLVFCTCFR